MTSLRVFAAVLLATVPAACVSVSTYPPTAGNTKMTPSVSPGPELMAGAIKEASRVTKGGEPIVFNLPEVVCHELVCHRYANSRNFLEAFGRMIDTGLHHPLCIIDMRMPVMNGFETAQRVRELDPEINIVICTAFSDMDPVEIRANLSGSVFFVRKPFAAAELYFMVHSLVDGWNEKRKLLRGASV